MSIAKIYPAPADFDLDGQFYIARPTGEVAMSSFRHGTEEKEVSEYLHLDGIWRLFTQNETGEHTGYFETWEIAVAALAKQ